MFLQKINFLEKFLFRYGTHYISSAEFGGQILFQNTRFAEKNIAFNDLAQQSISEIQSAFGSQVGGSLDASITVSGAPIDTGGGMQNTNFKGKGERKGKEDYKQIAET